MTAGAASAPAGTDGGATVPRSLDLAIGGMTCASCVARVERKIGKLPGATATVNLPLKSAHVELTGPATPDQVIRAVEAAGYTARLTHDSAAVAPTPAPSQAAAAHGTAAEAGPSEASGRAPGPGGPAMSGMDGMSGTAPTPPMPGMDLSSADMTGMAMGDMDMSGMGGMAMIPEDADGGRRLVPRLIVATVLAVPVVALSMAPSLQFPGWQWVVAALALPVATWCAWPFHKAAFRAARHLASTMDTLVSLGVIAATAWSVWALLWGGAGEIGMRMRPTLWPRLAMGAGHVMPELYFESAAVVTVFLLAGRVAQDRASDRAGSALRALLDLGAKAVEVERGGSVITVPIDQLAVGEVFHVKPGQKVATDGVVVTGHSALDESLLTGEPAPVEVGPGSPVTGATINTYGLLTVRAERVGAQTRLAQIGRLVAEAQTGKAPVQRLADRISAVFVPAVIVLALITLAAWLAVGAGAQASFTAAVAVLIIACPCALGLATPTALLAGTGRGAQLGILIKGPEILESTRKVTTVLMDKTGTVTDGKMRLQAVEVDPAEPALGGLTGLVVRVAGALEAGSEHPLAAPIAAAARQAGPLPPVSGFAATPGAGVEGTVDLPDGAGPVRAAAGRPQWLAKQSYLIPDPVAECYEAARSSGASPVLVGWAGRARGVLVLKDSPKPTSREAIAELVRLGLRPRLLTGDAAGAALETAQAVGIAPEDVIAQVQPEQKIEEVRRLQAAGEVVAMVGDGVNDAAALAQADLGMAMGGGTDAAIEASDITLVRDDLRSVPQAIRLSRRTLRLIKQNLFWAFAYNVAALPLAAFGLLNPMIAGAAMAASSVIVVTNSLRLRRFDR